ncbi:hypothetical protein E1B28_008085 [Marasmius oreades]|uniref:Uncharacterized protein n=1 Tax=Marasmius oreades TaxID=181124 RepID=A0A9P7UU48_9AGAR|nr:uncharacterized protein E1B28_008085 [Marasmius oreades]KAG7094487.1 hypothetical protein E1B28_008085 [Marasmius oreades]
MVTFEPEDGTDAENLETVWKQIYNISSSQRLDMLPQLFGLAHSRTPTLIFHDVFISGGAIFSQFGIDTPVVRNYLWYKMYRSFYAMITNSDMRRLLKNAHSINHEEWVFNFRSNVWQYEFTSSFSEFPQSSSSRPLFISFQLINQSYQNLCLEPKAIIDGLQEEFFKLVTSIGAMHIIPDCFIPHNLLPFGAIIDWEKSCILAHLPSIPSPEWCFYLSTHGVKARLSESASGRVDLIFDDPGVNIIRLRIRLQIPSDEQEQLRCAYLSQSLQFFKDIGHPKASWNSVLLMDEVYFILTGTFTSNFIHNFSTKVYLFIQPLLSIAPKQINNMPCLHWPLDSQVYYWSSDSNGKTPIPKENWAQYEIPTLDLYTYIGTSWDQFDYASVEEYLTIKGYDPYSDEYARVHGYQIINLWDPHTGDEWVHLESQEWTNTEGQLGAEGLGSNEALKNLRSDKFMSWLTRGWLKHSHGAVCTAKDNLKQITPEVDSEDDDIFSIVSDLPNA